MIYPHKTSAGGLAGHENHLEYTVETRNLFFGGGIYIEQGQKQLVHCVLSDNWWWWGTNFPKNQLVLIVFWSNCLPPLVNLETIDKVTKKTSG